MLEIMNQIVQVAEGRGQCIFSRSLVEYFIVKSFAVIDFYAQHWKTNKT